MARVEKNAAGKDVPVDTPAFGCHTVEHGSPPKTQAKSAPAKAADKDGDN